MKHFKNKVRMLLGAVLLAGAATAQNASDSADLILSRGEIYGAGGWAESMAVKDGVIIALGDDATVMKHRTANTRVIALDGAAVLPGLHDMHVHPLGAGLGRYQCRFPQGSGPKQVLDTIKDCASKRQKGEWISGGQWDAASFGRTPPHRSMLDRVAPNNPVVLSDISGHSVWANTAALQAAGITRETANPSGGIIERDAKGEATGLLREAAGGLVRRLIPPYTAEQNKQALKDSLSVMLSHGITSFTDAGVDERNMQAYAALADEGSLKQRVRGCVMWRPVEFTAQAGPSGNPLERRNLYARDRFSPDCVKIVLDGVPTDGHTAAMVEPYADATHSHDHSRAKGLLLVEQNALDKALVDLDAKGLTVKFHAAGDAAVRAGVDAIAAARKANGFSGVLHDVGHVSFAQTDDLARGRALAATFEVSPYIWYPNPIIPDIAKAIGAERMKHWIPLKSAMDAGALVVPGSDWPVVPHVNPWIALETLVTRQQLGGGGEVLGAAERISLEQALELFTVNSAIQMGNRHRTGRIEKGLLADVVVLDRNPFKIPVTQVHQTNVRMTLVNGEVVYEAAKK